MQLVILLPPSQAKTSGGEHPPIQPIPQTKDLLADIQQADSNKLYSGRAQEAVLLNQQALQAPTREAIKRYSGVLYKALNYPTLTNKQYIKEHVRIASALFGVIPATKHIPNYKFRITKLQAYKRLKNHNQQQLTNCYVVDLLAVAQRKSVEYAQGVRIEFTKEKNGRVIKAGHEAKRVKGLYVRWLAQNNIKNPQDIYGFSQEGYAWSGKTFHKKEN